MPKITEDMIHPELRKKARSLWRGSQKYSPFGTKVTKMMCRLLRGRHSNKMRYEQQYITRPDGSKLRICVYTPLQRKENVPGLLWIHGGGYAIGIPEQDDEFILRFVEASGCLVVSPDYTLSLDKPYPAALDDCYAALLWLAEHGGEYGVRKDQIFVGGDSAGGGLAAAVSLYARDNCVRDKHGVKIAYQMLVYPMLDDRHTGSSADNNAPLWHTTVNDASWKVYLGDLYGRADVPIYAAPGRAEDLTGLPPTCSYVGGIEPFHDETVAYMERLQKCGVPVHFKVFEGCFHAFDIMCPDAEVTKEAVRFLVDSFNYAVGNYFSEG